MACAGWSGGWNGSNQARARQLPSGGSRSWRARSQRRYDDLVTREPADDDEEVYGDAWPLINEWRGLWAVHSPMGKGLAWVSRRERILELEVSLLEEHGLTLPPETAPLRGLDRGEQLNWRQRELAEVGGGGSGGRDVGGSVGRRGPALRVFGQQKDTLWAPGRRNPCHRQGAGRILIALSGFFQRFPP